MTSPPRRPTLRSGLRHRDFRFFIGAFGTSAIGSWAYNVALAVWLIDATGSASWVAGSTVARFAPALVMSAYGGVIAERFERIRLMATLDWVLAGIMAVIAVEMALDAPALAVVLTAAISSSLSSIYEPAAAAMTPQLVPASDLGSANALRNTLDNICVIAGPGLGALLLLVADPWVALLANAATFVVSALLLVMVRERSTPVDVTEGVANSTPTCAPAASTRSSPQALWLSPESTTRFLSMDFAIASTRSRAAG